MRPVSQTPTEPSDHALLSTAYGTLLGGTRCTGAWGALALVGLRLHAPATARTVTTVLATSAANDFLHAAFTYVCTRTDASKQQESPPQPAATPRAA